MAGPQPWEVINDPDLYRSNGNINQQIVVPLSMLDAINDYMHDVRDRLWAESERDQAPPTPMDTLLPSVSNWSRSEGMKGSDQSVRAMAVLPSGQAEGSGQGPILTPPRPPGSPQTVAVVAYNGVKQLNKDVRRKRWGL